MKKSHFEQGDTVKIKMEDHIYFDQIGKIEMVLRNQTTADAILVKMKDGFHDWFCGFEENLEKIENFAKKS